MKRIATPWLSVLVIALVSCDEGTRTTRLCAPDLLGPADGATLDNGCSDRSDEKRWEFAWAPCPGAHTYHIVVERVGSTLPAIDQDRVQSATYTDRTTDFVADFNLTGWNWRVRARTAGSWGPWSRTGRFEVEPLDSDCP